MDQHPFNSHNYESSQHADSSQNELYLPPLGRQSQQYIFPPGHEQTMGSYQHRDGQDQFMGNLFPARFDDDCDYDMRQPHYHSHHASQPSSSTHHGYRPGPQERPPSPPFVPRPPPKLFPADDEDDFPLAIIPTSEGSASRSKAKGKEPAAGGTKERTKAKDRSRAQTASEEHAEEHSKEHTTGKRQAALKPSDKETASAASSKKKGGRTAGSQNFSVEECTKIVELVMDYKPIGGNGWDAVRDDYNRWAAEEPRKYRDRDTRSSKHKFEKLATMKKPTGDAERSDLLTLALEANDAITARSGQRKLNDDGEPGSSSSDNGDDEAGATTGGNTSVIDLSSEGEDVVKKGPVKKAEAQGEKATEKISTVKGFRTANPLETKERPSRVKPATASANEAIFSMGKYFTTKPEHDEVRGIQSYQMLQIQTLQLELQQERQASRDEIARLNDQLYQERRRADCGEDEVRQLTYRLEAMRERMQELRSHRYSPSPPRRRRHQYDSPSPQRSPSRRRRPRYDSTSLSPSAPRDRSRNHQHQPSSLRHASGSAATGPETPTD